MARSLIHSPVHSVILYWIRLMTILNAQGAKINKFKRSTLIEGETLRTSNKDHYAAVISNEEMFSSILNHRNWCFHWRMIATEVWIKHCATTLNIGFPACQAVLDSQNVKIARKKMVWLKIERVTTQQYDTPKHTQYLCIVNYGNSFEKTYLHLGHLKTINLWHHNNDDHWDENLGFKRK